MVMVKNKGGSYFLKSILEIYANRLLTTVLKQ